jgi:hypothetical protein
MSDDNNGDHTPPSPARGGVTPTRQPANNYASINTPIASAKRPSKKRTPVPSSAKKMSSSSSSDGGSGSGSGAPNTPIRTPKNKDTTTSSKPRYANLSPMHNVKPVPRDSHHIQDKGGVENEDETSSITATESTLSIVTEAPTVVVAAPAPPPAASTMLSSVGRKVDAIFSPVLSFLNGASSASGGGGEEEEGDGGEKLAAGAAADVASASADLSSLMAQEKKSDEEEEEEVQNMVREALLQVRELNTLLCSSSINVALHQFCYIPFILNNTNFQTSVHHVNLP